MEKIAKFVSFLEGKKTYILSIAGFIAVISYWRGWVTREEMELMFMLLTGGSIVTLRMAVKNSK